MTNIFNCSQVAEVVAYFFFIWLTITYSFHRALFTNELIFLIFFLNKKIYGKTFGTTNFINTYMSVRNEPLLTAEIFNFKKESLECIAHSRSRRGARGGHLPPPHFFPKKNFENLKLPN